MQPDSKAPLFVSKSYSLTPYAILPPTTSLETFLQH